MQRHNYPMHGGFEAAAKGRAGTRYNGDTTLRPKPGVGDKGSDPWNDSMLVTEPDRVNVGDRKL